MRLFVWALLGLSWGASAFAAPSLVVLEDNGETNPVYRQVMESIGAVIVSNNLGQKYDHIDLLTGSRATKQALFDQIRLRGTQSSVDVVILTHGANKRIALTTGDLTDADLRAAGRLPGLRMVYMMACYSASLLDSWRAAGAQVVIGHQDVNSLPGFFFPRFLKRWSQGMSARDAADDAYRFAQGTSQLLSGYLKDQDLLGAAGVGRSEPVIHGVDLDLSGQTYPGHPLAVLPVPGAPSASHNTLSYRHSDFERMGLELAAGMVPQATLNLDAIPSAQALVDRIGVPAWSELQDSFPDPTGTGSGDEIWIDGEELKYFLEPVRAWGGDKVNALLDAVQGVRLSHDGSGLAVAAYFSDPVTLSLSDESQTADWRPYAVNVPTAVRFDVSMSNGVAYVSGLDGGTDALNIQMKMPLLPDTVYLRNFSVDLSSGNIRVEAGIVGNAITVYANGTLQARNLTGVDVWDTIAANLGFLEWPALVFAAL